MLEIARWSNICNFYPSTLAFIPTEHCSLIPLLLYSTVVGMDIPNSPRCTFVVVAASDTMTHAAKSSDRDRNTFILDKWQHRNEVQWMPDFRLRFGASHNWHVMWSFGYKKVRGWRCGNVTYCVAGFEDWACIELCTALGTVVLKTCFKTIFIDLYDK